MGLPGWIQAISTVVLAVITYLYLRRTSQIAGATLAQARAANRTAELVEKQIVSADLDTYMPVLNEVSAALGRVRASKMTVPEWRTKDVRATPKLELMSAGFTEALALARKGRPSLLAALQGAASSMQNAEKMHDSWFRLRLMESSGNGLTETEKAFKDFHYDSCIRLIEMAESILDAIYGELRSVTDAWNEQVRRIDFQGVAPDSNLPSPPSPKEAGDGTDAASEGFATASRSSQEP